MKGYLTTIKYYPDNNRPEGFGIGLIVCTENGSESYVKFSAHRLKRINSAFGLKKSKLIELVFEDYSSKAFDFNSLEYMSLYEQGNIRFSKPKILITENLRDKFTELYKKYVADYAELEDSDILLKKTTPQKIGSKLRSKFKKNVHINQRLNIGYNFKNNLLGNFLIGNTQIDFIGGNGSIFCGEIINLDVNEESIQKNLFKTITLFEAIKETYNKHNKFDPKDCKFLVLKEHAENKENAEYMDTLNTWHNKADYDLLIKNSLDEFENKISAIVENKNIKKYEEWVREFEMEL